MLEKRGAVLPVGPYPTRMGVSRRRRYTPPHTFYEFLKTDPGTRAESWQLDILQNWRFPVPPAVGTYKSLLAGLQSFQPIDHLTSQGEKQRVELPER